MAGIRQGEKLAKPVGTAPASSGYVNELAVICARSSSNDLLTRKENFHDEPKATSEPDFSASRWAAVVSSGTAVVLLLVGFVALSAHSCIAQAIVGGPGAAFQTWTANDVNNNGAPYWDNLSSDGETYNIGFCLAGTGGCVLYDGAPGAIPFWGLPYNSITDSGGAADLNFFVVGSAPSGLRATLEAHYAFDIGTFGWFETNSTGTTLGTKHTLFTPSSPLGTRVSFTPTQFYGYWYTRDTNTYYTISNFNTNVTTQQRFTLFEPAPGTALTDIWIGVDDAPNSDLDYNDCVVRVVSTPE